VSTARSRSTPQIKEQFVKTPTILMTWPYKQLNLTISDQNSYLYDESDFIINAWGQGFSRMETFATQVKSISAGYKNICILHIDDRLLCFGDQTRGQLGTGLVGSRIIPKDRARPVELPDKDSSSLKSLLAMSTPARSLIMIASFVGVTTPSARSATAQPMTKPLLSKSRSLSDEGFDAATPLCSRQRDLSAPLRRCLSRHTFRVSVAPRSRSVMSEYPYYVGRFMMYSVKSRSSHRTC
jgi:hypothetical protein